MSQYFFLRIFNSITKNTLLLLLSYKSGDVTIMTISGMYIITSMSLRQIKAYSCECRQKTGSKLCYTFLWSMSGIEPDRLPHTLLYCGQRGRKNTPNLQNESRNTFYTQIKNGWTYSSTLLYDFVSCKLLS